MLGFLVHTRDAFSPIPWYYHQRLAPPTGRVACVVGGGGGEQSRDGPACTGFCPTWRVGGGVTWRGAGDLNLVRAAEIGDRIGEGWWDGAPGWRSNLAACWVEGPTCHDSYTTTVASKDSRSTMTRTGGTGEGRFILHFCQDSY